jgi:radical SAM-linked protein
VAEFRLRIGFAKTGSAIWLSHLEVVRVMERTLRRSGLPCAISQGFNAHLKHSFSAALPVGTGSADEYCDVDLAGLVEPTRALALLKHSAHPLLPIHSATYVAKGAPSLQVDLNLATYLIELHDPEGCIARELLKRFEERETVEVEKKRKLKSYRLDEYVVGRGSLVGETLETVGEHTEELPGENVANAFEEGNSAFTFSLLSRPEGSLRPEVLLRALAQPDLELIICAVTRLALEHWEPGEGTHAAA